MYFDDYDLIPNVGIKDIKIGMNFYNIRAILKKENINFEIKEHEFKNTGNAKWVYIIIKNYMTFYFANDVLWKIDAKGDFKGKLNNGIKLGMKIDDAFKLDKNLKFDEWEENYVSSDNYLLEDDYENNSIEYIAIGIKEAITNDLDEFYKYNWIKRYTK